MMDIPALMDVEWLYTGLVIECHDKLDCFCTKICRTMKPSSGSSEIMEQTRDLFGRQWLPFYCPRFGLFVDVR